MTGDELKAWRNSVGLSQRGLAQRMGVGERTLFSLESAPGQLSMDHQFLVDMASLYLATDHERDGSVLTDNALRVFVSVEHKVTREVRARLDPIEAISLTAVEMAAMRAMGNLLARDLTHAEQLEVLAEMRASSDLNGAIMDAAKP